MYRHRTETHRIIGIRNGTFLNGADDGKMKYMFLANLAFFGVNKRYVFGVVTTGMFSISETKRAKSHRASRKVRAPIAVNIEQGRLVQIRRPTHGNGARGIKKALSAWSACASSTHSQKSRTQDVVDGVEGPAVTQSAVSSHERDTLTAVDKSPPFTYTQEWHAQPPVQTKAVRRRQCISMR